MIAVKEQIISFLESDSTLQTLLDGTVTDKRIYPVASNQFEKFTPTQLEFITYLELPGGGFRTVPDQAEDLMLEFHIYSKTSVKMTEDIYSRLNTLLNYYKTTGNILIRWTKNIMAMDLEETDRTLFHKVVRYRLWIVNS